MLSIARGFSIRPGIITGLSIDAGFSRSWVREVQYERVGSEEYIIDSLSRKKLKNITKDVESKVDYMWYDNLLLILENYIDQQSGEKISNSYLYEIDINTGYIFRVPYIWIEYGFPHQEGRGDDLFFNESDESYINILSYLRDFRGDDVKSLFIKYNGRYIRFLECVDKIIASLKP